MFLLCSVGLAASALAGSSCVTAERATAERATIRTRNVRQIPNVRVRRSRVGPAAMVSRVCVCPGQRVVTA